MPGFTVDTHLFRELGELLVGRDSTALIELVKNSYDADATSVTVEGYDLDQPLIGRIVISDNGIGMTRQQFALGFLRIASRLKEHGDRRSEVYGRRFTGAKGVGRLAAHKLARHLGLKSVPRDVHARAISATIDWDKIEALQTLAQIPKSRAVRLATTRRDADDPSSTVIELTRLRTKWTPAERTRLYLDVGTFRPPSVLMRLPDNTIDEESIIRHLRIADVKSSSDDRQRDPGFEVTLAGDLAAGEEYWKTVAAAADWVIEIDAVKRRGTVAYAILPTRRCQLRFSRLGLEIPTRENFEIEHPAGDNAPVFQSRILIKEGQLGRGEQRTWIGRQSGVRVYMEGFRVLPYGEPSDDWLEIDADYRKRVRTLRFLDDVPESAATDEDEGLVFLPKTSYFGAVFLTQERSGSLRMLVNREGFIPDAAYDTLTKLVRIGIDLSVRVRAAARLPLREKRQREREANAQDRGADRNAQELKTAIETAVVRATGLAREARALAARGQLKEAAQLIESAANEFTEGSELNERLVTERSMLRILAGVGLQMAAFVHEINGLLGMAQSVEQAVDRLRARADLTRDARMMLARLRSHVGDLRRAAERQASYLTDVTSPDARRRRSRQKLAERFDAAARLVLPALERRQIALVNDIPVDLRSPPMFPAEVTLIFSNLLTNAAKAAGKRGRIRASGGIDSSGNVAIKVENTGTAVDLDRAERWFRPFATTTTESDPILGQGMGMGLPITRSTLEEYGAEVKFVRPSRGFTTALQINLTKDAE
ncbi:MAG TPA: ATP-binding protein [Chthoniobacterales bacterium]|nr:ATP-binding protein [Chthoniobacterales bacterium]